jgi:hypothetical protein
MALLFLLWQWTSYRDIREPRVVFDGVWVSCPEEDSYTERAFEYTVGKQVVWSLHLGPRDEFALFAGPVPPVHVEHTDTSNRLAPAYHYDDLKSRTGRRWTALGAAVNVIQIPTSDAECYGYAIRVEQAERPTWAHP